MTSLVNIKKGDAISLKSWSDDFGDLYSFLFYDVFVRSNSSPHKGWLVRLKDLNKGWMNQDFRR